MGSSCSLNSKNLFLENSAPFSEYFPSKQKESRKKEKNNPKILTKNIVIVPSKTKGIREAPVLKPLTENYLFIKRTQNQSLFQINESSFLSQIKTGASSANEFIR